MIHRKSKFAMAINFTSSDNTDKQRVIHSESVNIEVTIYDKTDEVIEELLSHFLKNIKLGWKH